MSRDEGRLRRYWVLREPRRLAEAAARRLVRTDGFRVAFAALADALLEAGCLDGAEAEAIVRDALAAAIA